MAGLRSVLLVLLVWTWGLSVSAQEPVARGARPGAHWQIQGQAGVLFSSLNQNVGSEWDHQIFESFMLKTSGLRWNQIGSGQFFWAYGGQLGYQSSAAEQSSGTASSKITTDMYTFSPEVRIGLEFSLGDHNLGAYTSVLYHLLNSASTNLQSPGYSRELSSSGVGDLSLSLGLTARVSETWVLVLGYDHFPASAASLGFIYEL